MKIFTLLSGFLITISVVLLTSCGGNCDDEKEVGNIYDGFITNSSLDTNNFPFDTIAGVGHLFEYRFTGEQCEDVFDDEYGYVINFTIADLQEDFAITDTELVDMTAYFSEYGAWAGSQHSIKSGTITGTKINETTWEVDASITTDPVDDQNLSKNIDFKLNFNL